MAKGLYENLKNDLKAIEIDIEKDFKIASKIMDYERKHNQGLKTWRVVSILLLTVIIIVIGMFLYLLKEKDQFTIFNKNWYSIDTKGQTITTKEIQEIINNLLTNKELNDIINKLKTEKEIEIFGKIWKSYKPVKITVITNKNCGLNNCTEEEENIVKQMQSSFNIKINTDILDQNDNKAKELIKIHKITKLPAFIFSKEINEIDNWKQLSNIMKENNDEYLIDNSQSGLPIKYFIEKPNIDIDAPVIGNKNAPITIYEFSDLQCPYCKKFHEETFPKIKEKYIDTNKVKILFIHVPLSFHNEAAKAAEASECANDQGKFLEFIELAYKNGKGDGTGLKEDDLKKYAQEIGLNKDEFDKCLDSGKYKDKVEKSLKIAESLGILGTPGFIINDFDFLGGAYPFDNFDKILQKYVK